ncbi:MAG: glycosyltransferase family 2 protein [Nitrospirae bacterium YQR-1]
MLLTIAIPNFNGAVYIADTIISCRNIRLPLDAFEILVMDNASTDNSVEIAEQLKALIPNIRIVRNQENIGRLPNWKKCITEARGTYLNYLFVTDQINEHNNIHDLVEVLNRDDKISMCASKFIIKYDRMSQHIGNDFFNSDIKMESKVFISSQILKGLLVNGFLQANLMRCEDISGIDFNETLPFTCDHIFSSEAALKRDYMFFSTNPQITWSIYKNPGRFHSKTTIGEIVRNNLEAAKTISQMVGIGIKDLYRFYALEIDRILYQKFRQSHLISGKSSFIRSFLYLFREINKNRISKPLVINSFINQMSKTLIQIVKKKLINNK